MIRLNVLLTLVVKLYVSDTEQCYELLQLLVKVSYTHSFMHLPKLECKVGLSFMQKKINRFFFYEQSIYAWLSYYFLPLLGKFQFLFETY